MTIINRKLQPILSAFLLIVIFGLVFFFIIPVISPPAPFNGPVEDITITSGSPEFSTLSLVAQKMGFFHKYGLNVTFNHVPTGALAIEDLMAGNADLAYAAEFVGVNSINKYPKLRIIGCTAKSDIISFVIRNDRNISSPQDLKGKTIAVPKGTQAEFFLGRYLTLNGLDLSDITPLYLNPVDLVLSIKTGESDAVVIWEPYVYQIGQTLGSNGITWPAQSGQRFFWLTYTLPELIGKKQDAFSRYFKALDESEQYISSHESDMKEIIKTEMNLSDEYTDRIVQNNRFALSLDQGLIIAMEDEYRWLKKNNLTNTTVMPIYLENLYPNFLLSVKPGSVNIIR